MNHDDTELNRTWWNERAGFHLETDFYQTHVDQLSHGGHTLLPLEVRELGDVTGLSTLHVQCHLGTDSLSLARLGASVTGVDFSRVAVEKARQLASELSIDARFIQAEIGELGVRFAGQFDLVFTSYGVISWLPDLTTWASNIAQCLKPGGRFYIAEMHPLAFAMADDPAPAPGILRLAYPYLAQEQGEHYADQAGSYADRQRPTQANDTREWSWSLGDVVTALLRAGLHLQWLREHAEGFCPNLPAMKRGEDGHYRLPRPLHGRYPLTFSVMAEKRR